MEEASHQHAPKRQRRQYRSCDNCRKGRRACDAVSLGINPLQTNSAGAGTSSAAIACSTCRRANKECTFTWLQDLPRGTLPESLKQKFSRRYDPALHTRGESSQGPRHPSQSNFPPGASFSETASMRTNWTMSGPAVENTNSPWQAPHREQAVHRNIEQQAATTLCATGADSSIDTLGASTNWLENIAWSASPFPHDQGQEFRQSGAAYVGAQVASFDDSGQSSSFESWNSPMYGSLAGFSQFNNEGFNEINPGLPYPPDQTGTFPLTLDSGDLSLLTDTGLRNIPPYTSQGADDITFNMREFDLTQSFSKGLISDRLLSIYHDSFENTLSCWVTVSNCPYKLPRLLQGSPNQRQRLISYLASTGFYQRIRRLDNAFSPLRRQSLSRGDGARVSKALMLAIMAFACQWTHSHDRVRRSRATDLESDAHEPQHAPGENMPDTTSVDPYDFERLVQQSLWNEAAEAVHACLNIDSFELVFALMIFAIMERPLNPRGADVYEHSRLFSDHSNSSAASSVPATISRDQALPSADRTRAITVGNERYLEIALRHLLTWKRRISSARRQQAARAQLSSQNISSSSQPILLEDYQAFDMLFWFSIMCDTTSAVLNEQGPVIPDDDSVFTLDDGQPASQPTGVAAPFDRHSHPPRSTSSNVSVWGSCLANAQPVFGVPAVRWPWPQDVGESLLQEATPVKVLLWRRLTVLHAYLSKETPPAAIERCIAETLKVYEYWQQHYGDFMLDCLANHAQLPFKIQSWYVVLGSHWHLAGLLLAQYIDLADGTMKSESVQRSLRQSSALVLELQKANAYAIANLARAAKPSDSRMSSQDQSFHYATAYGALVTEPWPEVLNRALAKACEVLLTWLSSTKDPAAALTTSQQAWISANTSVSELTRQSTSCIDALSFLGSSSDQAQSTASSLESRLKSLGVGPPQAFDGVHWQDFGLENLVY
ncbi:hypothetical protein AYO21_00007 [Fonsecaea monophora]|uniref:Zn(2)-C6 fungal-type domain-containing protein n=1 Tax=Fonsecaea monophora TaxID=254056 RepID=A0A177FM24_9EURO|nr:hypothetical protein AYO21_00007 [Fonsecaea monophora]KAH0842379.1 hypothetical protein FOPE_07193 [Fonsecaea pedrosoi]OAG45373.1 hypothetical protein AYO21_00007 [Fonsecaea monophora]